MNPRTGEQIFSGWPRGSESFGNGPLQSWGPYITNATEPSRIGVFRHFLFHDVNWKLSSLDYDRDLAFAEQRIPHLAAVDRDLTPFKNSGGKLIMYASPCRVARDNNRVDALRSLRASGDTRATANVPPSG
jgi:feruloyl esterase